MIDQRDNHAGSMSRGDKRRLELCMGLVQHPKLLLLDEPTAGMDAQARRKVWELIENEKANRTIILTTHLMDEADYLGDRIAIMGNGKLICCGSSVFLKNKFGVGYHMT